MDISALIEERKKRRKEERGTGTVKPEKVQASCRMRFDDLSYFCPACTGAVRGKTSDWLPLTLYNIITQEIIRYCWINTSFPTQPT
jgi:hypothetical protein